MTATPFGQLLKEWRARRGLSQLGLAVTAHTTQRHLSFIESGRAAPSRDMVLRLAATMDVPLRQQNNLLLAAGYAPVWRERDLAVPEMAAVSNALDYMLKQQEPFPAFVVDRRWNLLRANRGAGYLTEMLTGAAAPAPAGDPINLAVALMSPDGLRPLIANWPEVALYFLRGVQADAQADGTAETAALLRQLLSFADVPDLSRLASPEADAAPPVVPIHFRGGDIELRLFTTIATLGTPREITAQEIRIECFFPVDEATTQRFRRHEAAATAAVAEPRGRLIWARFRILSREEAAACIPGTPASICASPMSGPSRRSTSSAASTCLRRRAPRIYGSSISAAAPATAPRS